jgi:hypothetical protein
MTQCLIQRITFQRAKYLVSVSANMEREKEIKTTNIKNKSNHNNESLKRHVHEE